MPKAILQIRFVANNFAYEKQLALMTEKREKLLLLWITQNLKLVYSMSYVESMTFHHVISKREVEIVKIPIFNCMIFWMLQNSFLE